jgi:NAD(P) transhydrogenase
MSRRSFDLVVIGSGPAGQKAAICGAKEGLRVAVVERGVRVGGACVHYGTIPSKTLREAALQLSRARRLFEHSGVGIEIPHGFAIASLMSRLDAVLDHHEVFWVDQLQRNGIELITGNARLAAADRVTVDHLDGSRSELDASIVAIATGSHPREPDNLAIDHEHVFDSDSILTLVYLPRSMVVLGAGVIAFEYATIFAHLGVAVTVVDSRDRPMPFVDSELTDELLNAFRDAGGTYVNNRTAESVEFDGVAEVICRLDDGAVIRAEKVLVALGRIANSRGLGLESIGIELTRYGTVVVNEHGHTGVGQVYAIGDVIGPPSLASTSMDQGRRAIRHAVGSPCGRAPELFPAGIFTIPEISCIGLTEVEARERFGDCVVGRARFTEVARGIICGDRDGVLKLVAHPDTLAIIGVHIAGTSAAELVHVGQVGLLAGWTATDFVDNVFNFPTFAEAYRIAAFDLMARAELRLSASRQAS